jgi:hypothetical protein
MKEIMKVLKNYPELILKQEDGFIVINAPHTDVRNDCIQIYAEKRGNGYILSDDGYTFNDFLNYLSPDEFRLTAERNNTEFDKNELRSTFANSEEFAEKFENLINTVLLFNKLYLERFNRLK